MSPPTKSRLAALLGRTTGATDRRSLVVVCHPSAESLTRSALERVLRGLEKRGDEVRVLDLDALEFDPSARPNGQNADDLTAHREALSWANGIVFVYPTWFSGHPARLKGWFDRVLASGSAGEPPAFGSNRGGALRHVRRLDLVTSHGSSRLINYVQVHSGQRFIFRSLRSACHPLCRNRRTTIYSLDRRTEQDLIRWLARVEDAFSR